VAGSHPSWCKAERELHRCAKQSREAQADSNEAEIVNATESETWSKLPPRGDGLCLLVLPEPNPFSVAQAQAVGWMLGHCTELAGRAGHGLPPALFLPQNPCSVGRWDGSLGGTTLDPASSNGSRELLRSGAGKPQIKTCAAGISLCPLISPLESPLSLVPSPAVPWAESGRIPQPSREQERGTARAAPLLMEGSHSNVTRAINGALVLLLPAVLWFSVAGCDDGHGCRDATHQGSWEHRGQEEEEEEGAGWVVGAQPNTCIFLGSSTSRREDSVSPRLATKPRFNVCLATSCKGVKPAIAKAAACQWRLVMLLWGYGRDRE